MVTGFKLLYYLLSSATVIQSFSFPYRFKTQQCSLTNRRIKPLRLFEEYMSDDYNPNSSGKQRVEANANYEIGGIDLSKRWTELVNGGHVTAITELKPEDDLSQTESDQNGLFVRYGVRTEEENLLEFVEILPNQTESNEKLSKHVSSINATLAEIQQKANGMAIDAIYDGPYAIQLQLVRSLRPKRSKEMSSKRGNKSNDDDVNFCSCQPPLYDASRDSFLVGPLRLFGYGQFHGDGEPREKAARLLVPRDKGADSIPWDVFHNISPVDPRGHYLLLPDISSKDQWRDQSLNSGDCYDLTYLASTIKPYGSMVLSFNSVNAGASQNHIHAHAWLNPPPPLLYRNDPTAAIDSVYAVTKSLSIASLNLAHGVTASLLKYPCTCVKLSASHKDDSCSDLKEIGTALFKIVGVAQKIQSPHNVVWMNTPNKNDKEACIVEIYIFFRNAESVKADGETFRLGSSEMMGVFHASSKEQLFSVKKYQGLSCYGGSNVLGDVSFEPRGHVWAEISNILAGGKKTSRRLQALQKAELYKKPKTESDTIEDIPNNARYLRTGVPYFDDDK